MPGEAFTHVNHGLTLVIALEELGEHQVEERNYAVKRSEEHSYELGDFQSHQRDLYCCCSRIQVTNYNGRLRHQCRKHPRLTIHLFFNFKTPGPRQNTRQSVVTFMTRVFI